jgi:hypothetical protein
MNKRNAFSYAILGAFLLLFFLNTVSHDYFCRDELHTVCGPLHSILMTSEPSAAENILGLPPSLPLLVWNHDHILRPDFIRNIFHPPD